MDAASIFPSSPAFLALLAALGEVEDQQVVAAFTSLAAGLVGCKEEVEVAHQEVLATILHSVAFLPLAPAAMEGELLRLGLRSSLAAALAAAWAGLARAVVAARRKVPTNLVGVTAEVVRAVPGGEEEVVLVLGVEGRREVLRLTPSEAFALYSRLEEVQEGLDSICQ